MQIAVQKQNIRDAESRLKQYQEDIASEKKALAENGASLNKDIDAMMKLLKSYQSKLASSKSEGSGSGSKAKFRSIRGSTQQQQQQSRFSSSSSRGSAPSASHTRISFESLAQDMKDELAELRQQQQADSSTEVRLRRLLKQ